MPSPLSSLFGLNSSEMFGAQDSLRKAKQAAMRNRELDAQFPGTGGVGATATDVAGLDDSLGFLEAQELPGQVRTAQMGNAINEVDQFNMPQVREVREEQEGSALRKLLMPVQAKAQYDAALGDRDFERQVLRDRMNDDAAMARTQYSSDATTARQASTQANIGNRGVRDDLMRQRMQKQKEAGQMGWGSKLGAMLGLSVDPREDVAGLTQRIDALQTSDGDDVLTDPSQVAAQLQQMYPNASLEELVQMGGPETPQEADALRATLAQMGYR